MADDRIERPSYYNGQRLGARDFLDEQTYHRDQRRRHLLGSHTWGIIAGLELTEQPRTDRPDEVTVTLQPGVAVDGYGRTIVVFYPFDLPSTLLARLEEEGPQPVWIEYLEDPLTTEEDPCAGPNAERIRQEFRIVVGHRGTVRTPRRDDLRIGDLLIEDPPPAPLPDHLHADLSVPHQRFPGAGAMWLVRLGTLEVDGPGTRFLPTDDEVRLGGRELAGAIAASVLAPEGELRLANRADESVEVIVDGALTVEETGTFRGDVHLDGSSLRLRDAAGEGDPLALHRTPDGDDTHVDLQLGDGSKKNCFRVGPIPSPGSPIVPVLSVCNDEAVSVKGTLSAESAELGTLTVTGASQVQDLVVDGSLTVEGETTLRGPLEVESTALFAAGLETQGPVDRRIILGRAGTSIAALGVEPGSGIRYSGSGHNFYVGGVTDPVLSVGPDGIVANLAHLRLDLQNRLASHRISNTTLWRDLTTAASPALIEARQAIYVQIKVTLDDTGPDQSWRLQLRTTNDSVRSFDIDGTAGIGFYFLWLAKPPDPTNALAYTADGPAGTSCTLTVTLLGTL